MKKGMVLGVLLSCLLLATIILPAIADKGDVNVGGEFLIRLRAPAPSGGTELDRAGTVTTRLNNYLGCDPFNKDLMVADKIMGQWCVAYDNQLVVTVSPVTAKANGCTPKAQAEIWAARLRDRIPKLKAESLNHTNL